MRSISGCVLILTCALGGCSGRDPNLPDLVPVQGTITLEGEPLVKAAVYFMPTGSTPGTGSSGTTDTQGKYVLETLHDGKGAPVGEYKVTVSRIVKPDGTDFPPDAEFDPMGTPHKQLLSPKYSNLEESTLTATVPAGGGTIDFALKSKP